MMDQIRKITSFFKPIKRRSSKDYTKSISSTNTPSKTSPMLVKPYSTSRRKRRRSSKSFRQISPEVFCVDRTAEEIQFKAPVLKDFTDKKQTKLNWFTRSTSLLKPKVVKVEESRKSCPE